jgi:hypothetical protein
MRKIILLIILGLLFTFKYSAAQPPPPPPPGSPLSADVPIDEEIVFLLLSAALFAVVKINSKNQLLKP